MIRKYYFFLFFSFYFITYAQKNVQFSFEQSWSNNESFNEAYKKAIQEAKVEALRISGVKENIQSFSRLYTSEDNTGFSEIFESDILTDISGRIVKWSVSEPIKTCNDDISFISFDVEAKVKKYKTKRDLQFVARVYPEPKEFYESEEGVDFSLIPRQDCFVKIFYISETSEQLVYPLENVDKKIEQKNKYLLNKKWIKDRSHDISWLTAMKDGKNVEKGRIIIVLTKKDIPFEFTKPDEDGWFSVTNSEDIFKWILNIEKEDRIEYYYSFFIN